MKTNEIIDGLRKLSEQGSQYRRTVCRLAAEKLEEQNSKGVEIDQFNRWIPVTERLPEDWADVLVRLQCGDCVVAVKSGHIWRERWTNTRLDRDPTHWMPMPEPPREDA